ncbi:MAG: energy transducer TonB, partial [Roseomonas sp.]|nr:energy transducer TonB [Roseomonas sp.]
VAFAPPRASPRAARPPGSLDLSMGAVPARRSAPARQNLGSNMSHVAGAQPTGSWAGAFMEWVGQRKFYPRQAAQNGDDGPVRVRVVIERGGQVRSVELTGPSGSVWLNAGLQSIFRGQVVPRFTPDMEGDTMTMDFTMNYILLYR